ncbi:MAG TPA: hypothetical protein VM509_03205 [Planctomycetota bacterium]|nr:hypothetical protein [Planctomycetota bacterium]
MRTAILASLLALPLFTGCAAVAVGAIGSLMISNEVTANNVYEARLNVDVSKVWPTVKTTLSDKSMQVIEVDDNVRLAKAKIDSAWVTVTCEAYDLDKTVMKVRAAKYAGTINDPEMARMIQEAIMLRLERQK